MSLRLRTLTVVSVLTAIAFGAIALHGVRQANLTLGESVVVIGLGLIGQLTAQLCAAQGCRVFGIDLDPAKVALAKSLGMEAGSSGSTTAAPACPCPVMSARAPRICPPSSTAWWLSTGGPPGNLTP